MYPSRWIRLILALVSIFVLIVGAVLTFDQTQPSLVVNTVSVGVAPDPLVVDEETGRAFVYNNNDSTVSTLDTHSGALVRTVPVGSSFAWLAVAHRARRLFVSSGGDGSITMLDARSGRVLHIVTDTEIDVRQVAVDGASSAIMLRILMRHRDRCPPGRCGREQWPCLRRAP